MCLFKRTGGVGKARLLEKTRVQKNYQVRSCDQKSRRRTIAQAEQSSCSESASEECEDVESVIKDVLSVESVQLISQRLLVEVQIQKQWVTFRLDTGADVSLVEETLWQRFGELKLKMSTEHLRNASRRLMKFKGIFATIISYQGYEALVKLYVRHGTGSNLLGMDWIREVGLSGICIEYLKTLGEKAIAHGIRLSAMSATEDECLGLSVILDKYAPVFADELGCCSQIVGIQVNPDANLKVYPF